MMRRTCCPLVILVVLSILLNLSPAWGLGGSGHAKLWNDVLGIADRQSEEAIQPLWDAAQDVIDSYRDDYRELRGKFPWFTWGSYGHRLLFHWGFEADPKKHPQLKSRLKNASRGARIRKNNSTRSSTTLRGRFSPVATKSSSTPLSRPRVSPRREVMPTHWRR